MNRRAFLAVLAALSVVAAVAAPPAETQQPTSLRFMTGPQGGS